MAIEKSEFIWHNGKLIPWDDATIHVMSHVVHYGSSVFEGMRCYAPPAGPAIFRVRCLIINQNENIIRFSYFTFKATINESTRWSEYFLYN